MILAQYRGNSSPGQLVDSSIFGRDLITVGAAVGNPSSPTPPEGDRWLAKVANHLATSYLQTPGSIETAQSLQGSFEASVLPGSNGVNANVVVSYNDASGASTIGQRLVLIIDPTGYPTTYRLYLLQVNPTIIFIDSPGHSLDGLTHQFKFQWGDFGTELYLDGALIGSSGTRPTIPTSNITLAGWNYNPTDDNLAESYLDNVIFTDGVPIAQIETGNIEGGSIESGSIEGGSIQ